MCFMQFKNNRGCVTSRTNILKILFKPALVSNNQGSTKAKHWIALSGVPAKEDCPFVTFHFSCFIFNGSFVIHA